MCAVYIVIIFLEYRHIPHTAYVGTVIDDLSNSFRDCNITLEDSAINYVICVHSRELTDCYANPCESTKVFPSFCNEQTTSSGPVSLEVNGIENGNVVKIFCLTDSNCTGGVSEVMLFNIQIRKYLL